LTADKETWTLIIGIDIDNTITNTRELILEYVRTFERENDLRSELDPNHYDLEESLNWDAQLIKRFLGTYLKDIYTHVAPKPNALDVISALHLRHTLILITSRNQRDAAIKAITLEWLSRYRVEYDQLVMNDTENMHHFSKLAACLENHVEVMIEDHHDLSRELSEHIPVIMFDYPYNTHLEADNIIRVHDWLEVQAIITTMAAKKTNP
jgi:uncharacterized HAD superfamily protein